MSVRARQTRAEPAGFAPYGDFGTDRHPAHPARLARALAGSAASGEEAAGGGPKGQANPPRVPITVDLARHTSVHPNQSATV
jgi:hypothetical protein